MAELSCPAISMIHCLLCLLLALVQAATQEPDVNVKVFSMQKDLWKAPSTESFVALNMSVEGKWTELTVCYRYRLFRKVEYDMVLSLCVEQFSDYLTIGYLGDFLYICVQEKCQYYKGSTLEVQTLNRWYSECVIISLNEGIKFYRDGQELGFEAFPENQSVPLTLNGSFTIGQEQDLAWGGFNPLQSLHGDITQVNIWGTKLSKKSIMDFQKCLNIENGNIFSTDDSDIKLYNTESDLVPLSRFCMEETRFIVLPIGRSKLSESKHLCHIFNLTHYIPMNLNENEALFKTVVNFREECFENSAYVWLAGFNPGDGTFRNTENNKSLTFTNFYDGYIEPGEPRCLTLRSDGTWHNPMCELSRQFCTVCKFQNNHFLYLRGICEQYEFQTRYELQGYINQRPYFKGFFKKIIYWSSEGIWLFGDTSKNKTLATMQTDTPVAYPIGRNSWKLEEPLCGKAVGDIIHLSLSRCTRDEFMCSSGDCIAKWQRCNLLDDCIDSSDEEECHLLNFGNKYRNNQPPPNDNTGQPLQLETMIKILRFSNINDKEMNLNIDLKITMSWFESRVEYRNLNNLSHNNVISNADMAQLWTPRLFFKNVHNGQVKEMEPIITVEPTGPPKPYSFTQELLDQLYPGSSGKLYLQNQYVGTFSCRFELIKYPFDEQDCTIELILSSAARKLVDFDQNRLTASYVGESKLNNYLVKAFHVQSLSGGPHADLRVSFVLERRYSLVLVTTFLPCLLLLSIGYTSLYIRITLFMPRIMVSLTTLLVFYTLFSQASSRLPSTAYVKIIDIWFFLCMFLLFTIIVTHVIIDHLPTDGDVIALHEKKNYPRLTSERLCHLFRIYILPGLFLSLLVLIVLLYTMH
ncbi:uncharacterized protein LOC143033883 [Oratosquilla oratoria]|uniref:uncharacterized protein LOC143033883 n=1 Tax=Oratosquilla oratoria TaxID=337810 RepID=UPI003F76CE8E